MDQPRARIMQAKHKLPGQLASQEQAVLEQPLRALHAHPTAPPPCSADVENFPGFPEGILGVELTGRMRQQSERCGTRIFTETVEKVDLSKRPFKVGRGEGCRGPPRLWHSERWLCTRNRCWAHKS